MQRRFRSKGIIFGILLMSKRKWHVKQKKKITLVFFAYLTKCFAEMATIVITMSVKTWYLGVTPFLPFLACLYFLTARLTITPTIHTTVNSMTAVGAKYPLYFKYINDIDMYCHCLPSYHIYASFENFFKITTTVKILLRRGVGGV